MTTFAEAFSKFTPPEQTALAALRAQLVGLLPQLTKGQRDFFDRLFAEGVDGMTVERLNTAIDLCHRTIAKNIAGR